MTFNHGVVMADGRRDGPRLWDQVRKLIRIRRGKSNREIGEILTISPRMMKMNKHLEHISRSSTWRTVHPLQHAR